MTGGRRSIVKLVTLGLVAGVGAYLLTSAIRPSARRPPAEGSATLRAGGASFELHPDSPQLTLRSRDGAVVVEVAIALVIDDAPHPIILARAPPRPDPDALVATAPALMGDGTIEFPVEFRVDAPRDSVSVTVAAPPAA